MARRWICVLALWAAAAVAHAATPAALIEAYAAQAGMTVGQIDPARGQTLFLSGGTGDKQCASCHTRDPRQVGRTRVGKHIEPMAPVVNPARFTDVQKVEKWFGRNCKDVLGRLCSAQEKASVLAWLAQIR